MDTLPITVELPKCQRCGGPIPVARRRGTKFCCDRCCWADKTARYRERHGLKGRPDKVQRECVVCGAEFVSRRYSQIYCGLKCRQHVLNRRTIDKKRKTKQRPRLSQKLIYRRAAAIRAKRPRPPKCA